jgi:hypothetical protein
MTTIAGVADGTGMFFVCFHSFIIIAIVLGWREKTSFASHVL